MQRDGSFGSVEKAKKLKVANEKKYLKQIAIAL